VNSEHFEFTIFISQGEFIMAKAAEGVEIDKTAGVLVEAAQQLMCCIEAGDVGSLLMSMSMLSKEDKAFLKGLVINGKTVPQSLTEKYEDVMYCSMLCSLICKEDLPVVLQAPLVILPITAEIRQAL
jgi:hypothetical protein